MNTLLNGKILSHTLIKEVLIPRSERLKKENIVPKLSVLLVGNNPASNTYVKNKVRAGSVAGITVDVHRFEDIVTEETILKEIEKLNNDDSNHGIIVQLPLPKHIDENKIIEAIDPKKDVDGFTIHNKGALTLGLPSLISCTPKGIITLLESYNVVLEGAHVVIVGRSNIVGKPLANLLVHKNATVTIAHSKTKNLKEITKQADILVSAVGKANLIDGSYVKEGATVVDVGISRTEKGLCGDINFEHVQKKADSITPVPGGVGPMTVYSLLENTLEACENQTR